MNHYELNNCTNLSNIIDIMNILTELQVYSRSSTRTMAHHELNDCTNLSNIIDIMNSLTASWSQSWRALLSRTTGTGHSGEIVLACGTDAAARHSGYLCALEPSDGAPFKTLSTNFFLKNFCTGIQCLSVQAFEEKNLCTTALGMQL